MLLDMEWYWWVIIVAVVIVIIPFKIKFMKWWNQRLRDKKSHEVDKWGEEE